MMRKPRISANHSFFKKIQTTRESVVLPRGHHVSTTSPARCNASERKPCTAAAITFTSTKAMNSQSAALMPCSCGQPSCYNTPACARSVVNMPRDIFAGSSRNLGGRAGAGGCLFQNFFEVIANVLLVKRRLRRPARILSAGQKREEPGKTSSASVMPLAACPNSNLVSARIMPYAAHKLRPSCKCAGSTAADGWPIPHRRFCTSRRTKYFHRGRKPLWWPG